MSHWLTARIVLVTAAVLLFTVAFLVKDAPADHSGGLDCYACHAFSAGIVEPGTASMAKSAMTEIKTHGWSTGQRLSCTFCHRSVNVMGIPDVLSDFTITGVSRHPVSRNYVTQAVDNTAYMSNDNTSFAQHLDCRDCHDTTLTSYPDHDNGWLSSSYGGGQPQKNKATNPYGLRNVTAPKAYDDLCRACHGTGVTTFPSGKVVGKSIGIVTHDNGVDNTANAIKDMDNTQLRTQSEWVNKRQCTLCHDSHFSANSHLFSDSHELRWDNTPKPAISETTDCTNVCHYRGDAQNSYDTHGHGKTANWNGVALNRNCTFCHDATKPHQPASSDYSTKYRFPTLDNSWLTLSVFQKPIRSVCATCHPAGSYPLHQTSKGSVGCIDCHDQHAKNSDNNVMMIRNTNRVAPPSAWGISGVGATIGSEPVLFAKSGKYPAGDNVFHYYTGVIYQGDNTSGLCDQRACHGGGKASDNVTPLTPLSGLMTNSKHSGLNQPVSMDCESCHKHPDSGGSFRAVSSCTTCHGQPPPGADNSAGASYFYSESFTPHQKHASASLYQIDCKTCHNKYTDSTYHYTTPKTYQSLFFDVSVARGASAYDNSTLACTNIYCHSDGRAGNPNVVPQWMIPGNATGRITLNCAGCHNSDGVTLPQRMSSGAHTTHLNNGYACSACHVNTVSDDNVTLNPSTGLANHVNFTDNVKVNVTIKSAYDNDTTPTNNWDNATKTCSGISCHGGIPVKWTDIGLVTCASCHLGNGDVDDFGTGTAASMKNGVTARIDNNEWTWSGHGKAAGTYDKSGHNAAAFGGTNSCLYCHDSAISHDNAVNIFRLKVQTGVAGYGADSWNATCLICHSKSSPVPPGYNYPGGPGVKNSLDNGTRVETAHFGAKHGGANDNGGAFCFDCHDPHGDRISGAGNIFMIGKRVSRSTDNVLGIPVGGNDNTRRPAPTFTDNTIGSNYADNTTRLGICQVCHTAGSVGHWTSTTGDGHNAATKCTSCHSHDGNFAGKGSCLGCHGSAQGSTPARRQVTGAGGDFDNAASPTHHLTNYFDNATDGAVQNVDCSKCHWEGWLSTDTGFPAGSDGKTNPAYHYNDQASNATAKYVQLRIWSSTTPPTTYTAGTTAALWRNDGAWVATANDNVLNPHCLGCHRDTIGAATPFSDLRSPRIRAWDGANIGDKYLQTTNTVYSKVSNVTYNVVPQVINKAYSPHYDTKNNLRGIATTGAWADDQGAVGGLGSVDGSVACFSCHNSHGSSVGGTSTLPLTSYATNASLNAGLTAYNGGLLKQTTSGEGGYTVTYTPASNTTHKWGAGSALCFDCHVDTGATPPKKYTSYGHAAGKIIAGYYDPVDWRNTPTTGMGTWDNTITWRGSFSYKDNTIRATHFNPSSANANGTAITRQAPVAAGDNQILGRCSKCHDPHGVSNKPAFIANANYGVPALRGQWLPSPYLEDRPGNKNGSSTTNFGWTGVNSWTLNTSVTTRWGPRIWPQREYNRPTIEGLGYGTTGGGAGHDGYFIDENTFGMTLGTIDVFTVNYVATNVAAVWGKGTVNNTVTINRLSNVYAGGMNNTIFAGLCEKCHNPAALRATNSKQQGMTARAHLTVMNYGPLTDNIVLSQYFVNATTAGSMTQMLLAGTGSSSQNERWQDDSGQPWTGAQWSWGLNFSNNAGGAGLKGQRGASYIQTDYHQFPCSKCHTPHTSRLPRLLKTNCLDLGYSSTATNMNRQRHSLTANNNTNRFKATTGGSNWTTARAVYCHNNVQLMSNRTGVANDSRWNNITPW